MKPIGSAITTFPKAVDSATGTQLGAHGSGTPENSRLVEWLAKRSPADVDKAAVSQASRHNVGLRLECDYRFPKDEKGNSLGMVTLVKGCAVTGSEDDRRAALADIEKLQAAAPVPVVEGWLAELSVITAKRADDVFSETLRLEAYTSRLRRYPADVAREALLARTWKFWPSWAELEAICDRMAAPRKAMVKALAADPPNTTEDRERVSADRARQIMDEVFGGGECQ